jgi:hypothetical protein
MNWRGWYWWNRSIAHLQYLQGIRTIPGTDANSAWAASLPVKLRIEQGTQGE